ncbi:DoxX family protein [Sporichthya polymorpha]|uniref:DoxX family protein n=1 Tax=Sporichthya polymorpha TaxID=35751 RepID=UPI00037698F9|nr:DoxX family protein [Sporichthya polymorpha]
MTEGAFDFALLLVRVTLGVVMILHGKNHLWGAGGVEGTARWFASLGFKPAKVHALMSGWGELAAGAALILGFFTPFACASVIGTMCVAGWAAHRPNGFFIFRDGYEYVLVIGVVALALGILGPGGISLDSSFGLIDYDDPTDAGLVGRTGGLIAGVLGVAGAAALLATSWRPVKTDADADSSAS